MKNILSFENFEMNEKVNPKKQFGLTTQIQDSIKKLCNGAIHKEAVKCHENDDKSQTYAKYIKECSNYMNECMNEAMEVYRNGKNTAGTY